MRALALMLLVGCAHQGSSAGDVRPLEKAPPRTPDVPAGVAAPSSCAPRPARLVFASMPPTLDTLAASSFHPTLATSADSRLIAAPTMDGRLFIIDAEVGAIRGELVGHRGAARAVAFVDDHTLASIGVDHTLRLWDLQLGTATKEVDVEVDVTALAASPRDGSLVLGGKDGKVRLFDRTGRPGAVIDAHEGAVARVAWRPDGGAFASSGGDRMHGVYHYASDGTKKANLNPLGGGTDTLAFQPGTGRLAIDYGMRDQIRVIALDRSFVDLERWSDRVGSRPDAQVNAHWLSFAFAPDGKRIAFATCGSHTGIHDFAAKFGVIDVATDNSRFFTDSVGSFMICPVAVVWTSDGRRVARMSDRQGLEVFSPDEDRRIGYLGGPLENPFEGKKAAAFEQRVADAMGLALQPTRDDACEAARKKVAPDARGFACDASRAFAGDILGPIHVHDSTTGAALGSYTPRTQNGARRGTTQIAVAPDGKLVASWAEDGSLVVTDATAPFATRLERRGVGVVTRLSWTADGRHIALFSGATLRVVRLSDGAMLRVEHGIASDDAGAFEDLGEKAAGHDLLRSGKGTLAQYRGALRVRVGDLMTGDLVPLERAAAKPGLVRAFLAGEPGVTPTLAVCAR